MSGSSTSLAGTTRSCQADLAAQRVNHGDEGAAEGDEEARCRLQAKAPGRRGRRAPAECDSITQHKHSRISAHALARVRPSVRPSASVRIRPLPSASVRVRPRPSASVRVRP
eukprot:3160956-Prymnesium_polylepis.1